MAASELTTVVLAGPGVGADVWDRNPGRPRLHRSQDMCPPQKEIWPHTNMEIHSAKGLTNIRGFSIKPVKRQ